jgi:hypothetical protein
VTVLTFLQLVTGQLSKLYKGLNTSIGVGSIAKVFVTSVRSNGLIQSRRTVIELASLIYKQAMSFFKSREKIPDAVLTLLMGCLSVLKSIYNQPEIINNAPAFDQVNAQRNYLSFCNLKEVSSVFMPYLFNLSFMD